jgi:hypothetical protein
MALRDRAALAKKWDDIGSDAADAADAAGAAAWIISRIRSTENAGRQQAGSQIGNGLCFCKRGSPYFCFCTVVVIWRQC